jgi:aspartyl-tRNA(Asn)/glutamyl-tRNA(Gln) amidotransferase subunit A
MKITNNIQDIHQMLLDGKTTSDGITKESITLARKYQKDYNSFVTILDASGNENINHPLAGIPYAAKDLFSTKDILTTGSSNALKDYIPFYNATVINRLNEVNSVLIGKTVCDEFGLGGTCTTGHTGSVKNPWNPLYQAGGSSGGSAAAVALGIVPYALGTDTGDSVRKPAAYCGVVGYKPTYGTISRYGVLPFASSLDHVGVFTRNVKDAAIVVDSIKGPDGKDMTCLPKTDYFTPSIDGNVKGKKLFYIKELCNLNEFTNPTSDLKKTLTEFQKTLELAKKLGIEVTEESVDLKLLKAIYPTYMIISCAEATSNLSMYTGIIYGPRGIGNNINDMLKDYRTKCFSPLIKRRLVIGSYVLQKENQDRYFLNACRVRRLIIDKMNDLFKKYDGLILPASGGGAPLLKGASEVISDKRQILENHLAIGNFGGFPSITIPNGFIDDLPIGINITGKIMDDANVLNMAYAIEQQMKFHDQIVGGKHE